MGKTIRVTDRLSTYDPGYGWVGFSTPFQANDDFKQELSFAGFGSVRKSQHIRHAVKAGFLISSPERGLHGTAGENAAVFRNMGEFDPLARSGKNDLVITNHCAAAQGGKADITPRSYARMALTGADRVLIERDLAALRHGRAKQNGRAGGRIHLHAMMDLHDLDVIVGAERAGRLAGQRGEEIDAEAHITRTDDHRMPGSGFNFCQMLDLQAGRSNDMNDSGLGRERGEFHRGMRGGEIEKAIGACYDRQRIAADGDAHLATTRQEASILSDGDGVRVLDRTGEMGTRRLPDDFHKDAAHASGRTRNDEAHVTHTCLRNQF